MSNRRRAAADAPGGSMADVFEDLRAEGHLTGRQHQAVIRFLAELQTHHGRSDGIVGQIAERVQTSVRARLWPPGGPSGNLGSLDARLNRLRGHERRLMAYLIKHRELTRGSLRDFGRVHSAYTKRETARAYAVGRIAALAETLADEYLGPIESEA
jgi:hypothetical protein